MYKGSRVLVFLFGLTACGPSSSQCIPGATMSCTCSSGASGAQICDATGMSFGPCNCSNPIQDMAMAADTDMSKPVKRIFVTSRSYRGDLKTPGHGANGLDGADKLCQLNAMLASIGGTWKAWLSDANTAAIDRINEVGPWYLIDGTTKAFDNKAQMRTFPYVGISLTEFQGQRLGQCVWTGTRDNATTETTNTCSNYTTGSSAQNGHTGLAGNQDSWTDFMISNCVNTCGLFCIEQ